jgi:hypothetical protein
VVAHPHILTAVAPVNLGAWPALALLLFLSYCVEESPLWLERQALSSEETTQLNAATGGEGMENEESSAWAMLMHLWDDAEGRASLGVGVTLMLANQVLL